MKISLGFSPCPNDTFIFDALVNNKLDTGGLSFDVYLEDVETLNQWALQGKLDISKLSYGVLPLVLDHYLLLNSGSAMGKAVGPLLITGPVKDSQPIEAPGTAIPVEDKLIAIPGEHTTAHMLFSLAFPKAKNKIFLKYDEIENFVLDGKGLGVIIHENRFTYAEKGLTKITDLGDFWEKETGKPIPLGGIVANRRIEKKVQLKVQELIQESIAYAYRNHYEELAAYVKAHAREMNEDVMRKHIDLYVNDYSLNLGDEGRNSIRKFLEIYAGINPDSGSNKTDVFL